MYIRGLIPRNFAELAGDIPIDIVPYAGFRLIYYYKLRH